MMNMADTCMYMYLRLYGMYRWRCIPCSLHVPFFMDDRAQAIFCITIKFEKAVFLCPPMARRHSNQYRLYTIATYR